MSKSQCWEQANQEAQAEAKRGEHTPDNGKARREYAEKAINAYASHQSALAAKDKTIAELREALRQSEDALSKLIEAAVISPRVVIQRPDFDSALVMGDNVLDAVRAALASVERREEV